MAPPEAESVVWGADLAQRPAQTLGEARNCLGNAEAWEQKIVEGLAGALGGHVPVGRGRGKSQREARGPPSALGQRSQDPGVRAVLPGESRVQGDADFSSGQLVFEGPMKITGRPGWC